MMSNEVEDGDGVRCRCEWQDPINGELMKHYPAILDPLCNVPHESPAGERDREVMEPVWFEVRATGPRRWAYTTKDPKCAKRLREKYGCDVRPLIYGDLRPPAGEPVAWGVFKDDRIIEVRYTEPIDIPALPFWPKKAKDGFNFRPLYLRPPAGEPSQVDPNSQDCERSGEQEKGESG